MLQICLSMCSVVDLAAISTSTLADIDKTEKVLEDETEQEEEFQVFVCLLLSYCTVCPPLLCMRNMKVSLYFKVPFNLRGTKTITGEDHHLLCDTKYA